MSDLSSPRPELTGRMYHDYRIKRLVDDTLMHVMQNASSSVDGDDSPRNRLTQRDSIVSLEMDYESDCPSDSDLESDSGFHARAHWIQLHKLNKQGIVIQNMIIHILKTYKQVRPIWQFGRQIDDRNDEWIKHLYDDFYFRHHCASIQAAITMVMENRDDREGVRRLMQEVGAHHFFYDAYEPHLHLFEDGLISSMQLMLNGACALDDKTEESWRVLIRDICGWIAEGIAIQRSAYLRQCVTQPEIGIVKEMWEKVRLSGLQAAGESLCYRALKSYTLHLSTYRLAMPSIPIPRHGTPQFTIFAEKTIQALDITVESYMAGVGFMNLAEKMKDYVIQCMILEVCPSLVRKAYMEGLIEMLQKSTGEDHLADSVVQIWSKVYRVMEQAILINIINF